MPGSEGLNTNTDNGNISRAFSGGGRGESYVPCGYKRELGTGLFGVHTIRPRGKQICGASRHLRSTSTVDIGSATTQNGGSSSSSGRWGGVQREAGSSAHSP